jgi:hypothetical protein
VINWDPLVRAIQNEQARALGARYADGSEPLDHRWKNITSSDLAPILAGMGARSDLRIDLAVRVLERSQLADAAPLEALAAVLGEAEQREILARVGRSNQLKLLAVGFAGPVRLDGPATTTAADRARASRSAIYPALSGGHRRIHRETRLRAAHGSLCER